MTDTQRINIEAVLTERREIAIIWSIEDVTEVRPDLSEAQAWEVLKLVRKSHDATIGVSWETLKCAADTLFGYAAEDDAA